MSESIVTIVAVQDERIRELLRFNNEFEERARLAERVLKYLTTPRPIEEYHEDMGPVLWWCLKVENTPQAIAQGWSRRWLGEPPYVGSPNDLGREVAVTVTLYTVEGAHERSNPPNDAPPRFLIGGWPGYHTHWTPLPKVGR